MASPRVRPVRPAVYRPELPTRASEAPSGEGWLHELDYAGERLGAGLRAGKPRIEQADGSVCTERHATLAGALSSLPQQTLLIDGTLSGGTYYAFDLLQLDGRDLTDVALAQRKQLLAALLTAAPAPIRYCDHVHDDGPRVLSAACKLGARGVLSKRADAPHRSGRSENWLQVPCPTQPARKRTGRRVIIDGVTISSPERIMYPRLGFNKGALVQLYAELAPWILPHVQGRPLTLVRCEHGASRPDALRSECQFLRHSAGWHRFVPDSVHREQIVEQRKRGEYLVIQRAADLLSILNGDIIELHTWNARIAALEQPDQLVFDLDPAEDIRWPDVRAAAQQLRALLREHGLASWPKITGGKGLHVCVPLVAAASWDACFAFSHTLASELVCAQPRKLTTVFGRAARAGKILIDYKRNHRAAVAIAAFSTRARPNGALAVPIGWDELDQLTQPDPWNVLNIRDYLSQRSGDPWRAYFRARQKLPARGSR